MNDRPASTDVPSYLERLWRLVRLREEESSPAFAEPGQSTLPQPGTTSPTAIQQPAKPDSPLPGPKFSAPMSTRFFSGPPASNSFAGPPIPNNGLSFRFPKDVYPEVQPPVSDWNLRPTYNEPPHTWETFNIGDVIIRPYHVPNMRRSEKRGTQTAVRLPCTTTSNAKETLPSATSIPNGAYSSYSSSTRRPYSVYRYTHSTNRASVWCSSGTGKITSAYVTP